MLAVADRCTSDHCAALALLDNPSQVRANLSGQTLDRYLDHYLTAWAQPPDVPLADATSTSAATGQPGAPPHKLVDIDFPSAASIPAISIMNPEPAGPPGAAAVAAATAGEPKAHDAPASSRRARKPAPAPVQATASAPPAPPVDPVWLPRTEPATPAATAAAPTATGVAPAGAGPVQLNPFQPQPLASTGAARAQ